MHKTLRSAAAAAGILLPGAFVLPAPAQTPAQSAGKITAEQFEAVGTRLLDKLAQWVAALEGAVDKPSALAAKPKLEKMVEEIRIASAEAASMAQASPEIQNAFYRKPKLQERASDIQQRLVKETRRIAMNRDVLTVLQPTLAEFQRASTGRKSDVEKPAPPPAPAGPK